MKNLSVFRAAFGGLTATELWAMPYDKFLDWHQAEAPDAECVYCAVNQRDEIQWVLGSSTKTRYYKTDHHLKRAVAYHNKYHPEDPWRVAAFRLICVAVEDYDDISETERENDRYNQEQDWLENHGRELE